jgi:hypothetical protein
MRNNNASLDKKKARMAEAFLSRSPAAASECAKSAGAGWLQLRGGGGGGGRTWRTTRASLTPRYLPPRDSTPSADRGLGGGDGEVGRGGEFVHQIERRIVGAARGKSAGEGGTTAIRWMRDERLVDGNTPPLCNAWPYCAN